MSDRTRPTEVQLGLQGRVVIPAPLRRALGIEPGETLVARIEGDRLVLEKQESIKRRLKTRFAAIPAGGSLATEITRGTACRSERDEQR